MQSVSQLKSQLTDRQMAVFTSEIGKHQKSAGLAYVLWFFLGTLGIHQFYIGRAGRGAFYLLLGLIGWISLLVAFSSAFVMDPVTGEGGGGLGIGALMYGVAFGLLGILLLVDLFTIPRQIHKKLEEKEKELILDLQDNEGSSADGAAAT